MSVRSIMGVYHSPKIRKFGKFPKSRAQIARQKYTYWTEKYTLLLLVIFEVFWKIYSLSDIWSLFAIFWKIQWAKENETIPNFCNSLGRNLIQHLRTHTYTKFTEQSIGIFNFILFHQSGLLSVIKTPEDQQTDCAQNNVNHLTNTFIAQTTGFRFRSTRTTKL